MAGLLTTLGVLALTAGLVSMVKPLSRLMIRTRTQGMLLAGGGLSLVFVTAAMGPPATDRDQTAGPPASPSVQALAIGQQGTIDVDLAVVALDERSLEAVAAAMTERTGTAELVGSGRAFLIPYGTRVEVMERGPKALRVRVLDGPRAGRDGWVPATSSWHSTNSHGAAG